MARSPDVIVDASPLDAPSVDVPLRVGWLLRTCRLNATRAAPMTAGAFAAALGVGPAMVTKWEKGVDDIDATGLSGYERLVGVPAGSLRGIVEMTRRAFRYPVTPRLSPVRPTEDLAELSALLRPAMQGIPQGIDWLHFADALDADGPLMLPDFAAAPVIDRLASELTRSVDAAYLTRYAAMAQLRTGRYRDVVLGSLLASALAESAQVSVDLLDVAGELPSPELFSDMTRLLFDTRDSVFVGACHALGKMAALGGISKAEMRNAVPGLVRAYNAVCCEPSRHAAMSELIRNLPPGVESTARQDLDRPLAELPPMILVRSQDSPLYRAMQSVAEDIKAELPAPDDRVLERLLFEAMFDPIWTKQFIARLFLVAVPYKEVVSRNVTKLAERHELPQVREAATAFTLKLGDVSALDTAYRWAGSTDPRRQGIGLATLGHWGTELDRDLLEAAVGQDWSIARQAVYAAGMSGSPLLGEWADDPGRSDQVRAAAQWWRRQGSRIMA